VSKVEKNPFAMPGEGMGSRHDKNPSPNKDIFQKPNGGGGGGPRRKPEPAQKPEEDLVPEQPKPLPPQEPQVKLSNPK